MSLNRLQEALKTILIDNGDDILNDLRKTKAYLGDYTGDECREEIKMLLLFLQNSVHIEIFNEREFDTQTQLQFTRQAAQKYAILNYNLGVSVLDLLFSVFFDCGYIRRKIIKATSIDFIDEKMELWRKKLLDLGKRNRLINYHDTKRSSLKVTEPGFDEIWNRTVIKGRPLEFLYIDEFDEDDNTEKNVSLLLARKNFTANTVISNQPLKEQQKTLRNLKSKAKSIFEEQGVDVLYLAFAFLNWKEQTAEKDVFSSPIILVPALLSQKSIASPYTLSIDEDEIVINPTLAYKMEHDFGIILPEFDIDRDVNQYLGEIEKKINMLKDWSIEKTVVLSLFSFLKINMYNDLVRNELKIKNHPLVKAFCGDVSQLKDPLSINPTEYDHDKKNPADIFQILDADSSQQDAIVSAKNNLSFVLQGPPGTGKSQTIANIIAECLASGKKVLFVSEKLAALDVVYKRLSKAELGDFCLPLHSKKSNKKEILAMIGATLNLPSKKGSSNTTHIFTKLSLNRDILNLYIKELHTKRSALNRSVYEIWGQLIKLNSEKDIFFEIYDIDKITDTDFENMLSSLEDYCLTISSTTNEMISNPWYKSTIKNLTYELRHEIAENLDILIQLLSQVIPLIEEIKVNLSFNADGISNTIKILGACSNAVKFPFEWIKSNRIVNLMGVIEKAETYFSLLKNDISELYISLNTVRKLHPAFNISGDICIRNITEFNNLLNVFKSFVRSDDIYAIWEQMFDFAEISSSFHELNKKVEQYVSIRNQILLKYEKEILEIDSRILLKRYQLDYSSILKIIKIQYYRDNKLILGHLKSLTKESKKLKVDIVMQDLKLICELNDLNDWFEAKNEEYQRFFGGLYKGPETNIVQLSGKIEKFKSIIVSTNIFTRLYEQFSNFEIYSNEFTSTFSNYYDSFDTNWISLKNAAAWCLELKTIINEIPANEAFIKRLSIDDTMPSLCKYYHNALSEKSTGLTELIQWFYRQYEKNIFKTLNLPSLLSRIRECRANMPALDGWIDYSNAKSKCIIFGLLPFLEYLEKNTIEKKDVIQGFKKHFYLVWIDFVFNSNEILRTFRAQNHERILSEFRYLDDKQLSLSRQRVYDLLIDKMPNQNTLARGGDEFKILLHELNKKKRIIPLRKLFQRIPNILLTLKPCLMMSPLTVSLFLESSQFSFDTVIFDEASQVCTENAIGAISRGKLVILAGDSRQLPPTAFFTAAISDHEYDEEDKDDYTDIDSFESILDEADSYSFPSQTLKWHYRSRHEHLIAFSNSKIYNNKLITFPSNIDRSVNNGVEYIYVENGLYDRGGKKDNPEEAKKVVSLIFENIKFFPNRSLGVITFSVSQREAIETILRKERLNKPEYEYFFNEEKEDSFFIKNIETVQGDERDSIIFSIGYGKDYTGKMSMFFGPLSSTGGERRLNVAITRAKYNVKLVGSILSSDIKTERITSEGPKLLRSYIDYAQNGPKTLLNENIVSDQVQFDSPFEEAVYDFLIQKGYQVSTQIGCSGYRIDLGIHSPKDYSVYCLGIECDGATYHSAKTARERDRLRQTILEDMGWKIYRIWSTEWIRNMEIEKAKLIEAINDSILYI